MIARIKRFVMMVSRSHLFLFLSQAHRRGIVPLGKWHAGTRPRQPDSSPAGRDQNDSEADFRISIFEFRLFNGADFRISIFQFRFFPVTPDTRHLAPDTRHLKPTRVAYYEGREPSYVSK